MALHKLHYFPVRSRGETLRMMLEYTKIPYANHFVTFGEWMEDKDGVRTKRYPLGPGASKATLPVLEMPDGSMTPDSHAIAKWIAETAAQKFDESDPRAHLKGESPERSAMLFGIADADPAAFGGSGVQQLGMVDPILNFFPREESEPMVGPFLSTLPRVMRWFAAELKKAGGTYFGGKYPSYADFFLLHIFTNINTLDGGATLNERIGTPSKENDPMPSNDDISALRAWYATMSSIPEVAKYMKERPQTGSGIGMADGTGVGMPNSIIVSTDTPSDLDVVKSAIGAGAAPASGA